MMNVTLMTATAAAFAGIGGLCVSGMSAWLAFKNRSASHRDYVYQKQAESLVSLYSTLNAYYQQCQEYLFFHGRKGLNEENRNKFRLAMSRGDISKVYWAFQNERVKTSLFLPDELLSRIGNFEKVLLAISASEDIRDQYPQEISDSDDPGYILGQSYVEVVSYMRHLIGTEAISKDNIRIIGRHSFNERHDPDVTLEY